MNFASHVLMCRPASFGFNEETGLTNSFQQKQNVSNANEIACAEFDGFVSLLRENEVEVTVIEDTLHPSKPDAIFLNNWFSTHVDGKIFLYPMLTANRRAEVRKDVIDKLKSKYSYTSVIDLTGFADQDLFLEGTGSLVFDHSNKKCYASLSPRTNIDLIETVCDKLNYKPVVFKAIGSSGEPIYHTNVVMCVGEKFCVACVEAIQEKELFIREIQASGLELIAITRGEMECFAGNMLMLKNRLGENILVMSHTAFTNLPSEKLELLAFFAKIVHPEISLIESIGGGSARCMLAEIFIP